MRALKLPHNPLQFSLMTYRLTPPGLAGAGPGRPMLRDGRPVRLRPQRLRGCAARSLSVALGRSRSLVRALCLCPSLTLSVCLSRNLSLSSY
jgi:hypothetical protein